MDARALVRAMLTPHDAENSELRERGFTTQETQDLFVLGGCKLMCGDHFRSDRAHHRESARAGALPRALQALSLR